MDADRYDPTTLPATKADIANLQLQLFATTAILIVLMGVFAVIGLR